MTAMTIKKNFEKGQRRDNLIKLNYNSQEK